MKNLLLIFCLLGTAFQLNAQGPCPLPEEIHTQDDQVSDLIISETADQIVVDDFELAQTRSVNSVCIIGNYNTALWTSRNSPDVRTPSCEPNYLLVSYFPHNTITNLPINIPIVSFNVTFTSGVSISLGNSTFVRTISVNHTPYELDPGKYWVGMHSEAYTSNGCALYVAVPEVDDARSQLETRVVEAGYAIIPSNGSAPFPQGSSGLIFAVGALPAAAIPTLSEWGLIILSMTILIAGVSFIRRKVLTTA